MERIHQLEEQYVLERYLKETKVDKRGVYAIFHYKETGEYAYDTGYITCIGNKENPYSVVHSLWARVAHLREKNWWLPHLEEEFIREVTKKLHGRRFF